MIQEVYQHFQQLSQIKTPWEKLSQKQKDMISMVAEATEIANNTNPFKFKVIVYDIELANDPKAIGGWGAYDKMEVSCIGTYDYSENQYRIWQHTEIADCISFLHTARMIVGFNNISFDDNVLKARGLKLDMITSYDILREIWKGMGLDPINTNPVTHGGTGLGRTSTLTFGSKKSGEGAHAMKLWEEGKYAELYSYCLNDVRLTKKLMDRIVRGKPLNSGNPSRVINVPFSSGDFLAEATQETLF